MRAYYAAREVRKDGKRTSHSMHREIFGLQPGDPEHVDHKNHNTLDNRRKNLRVGSHRKNHENRKDQSKYGVGVEKTPSGRFRARIWIDGCNRRIGIYDTPKEAQTARRSFLRRMENGRQ